MSSASWSIKCPNQEHYRDGNMSARSSTLGMTSIISNAVTQERKYSLPAPFMGGNSIVCFILSLWIHDTEISTIFQYEAMSGTNTTSSEWEWFQSLIKLAFSCEEQWYRMECHSLGVDKPESICIRENIHWTSTNVVFSFLVGDASTSLPFVHGLDGSDWDRREPVSQSWSTQEKSWN